ncbi:hypothetical protein MC7420_4648 [Coleofasciculus chthonoplastes PCC 7420]|uniref:DUF2281 domain-containing protein n=1 Tax=Coleofasciculus chthonoplastes PCC 7420 TaxID=118168 RepID=B4VP02_9CYAN|nr:hypothetical protein [Coleofasciculus chthonoplastes]EDX76392.1 hypothetical protein MC7420_4648 [Coleofasciculus chthonoplastes PCC 7420]
MTQEELLNDFLSLPTEAQRQVLNFIAFLKKYRETEPTSQATDVDLVNDPFIGMWRERQDLANSTAWVRSVRENEWSKSRG